MACVLCRVRREPVSQARTPSPMRSRRRGASFERAAKSSLPPLYAVHHLLSVGVQLLPPSLMSVYDASFAYLEPIAVSAHVHHLQHWFSIKKESCQCLSTDDSYCSVCLRVLLPAYNQEFKIMEQR
ncbi:hypothetical protein EJB05_38386 [Eragrostis curvula]|uniref:Uncharacterized protein n=1 Tax=Eragrostis curvula TaxID=38414 RepID=A0A5J9TU62_9POAL|nr:hypothetical protein EJB05_38386 [Eragrostis curvula]